MGRILLVAVAVAFFLIVIYLIFRAVERKEKEETGQLDEPSLADKTQAQLIELKRELEDKQQAVTNLIEKNKIVDQLAKIDKHLEQLSQPMPETPPSPSVN